MTKARVAIVGGTGYGGMELLRYLLDHPAVEVTAITSRTETGAVGDVHPHLRGLTALRFSGERAVDLARGNDVLFFATPHGVARKEVPEVLAASPSVRVVDLSQDWRHDTLVGGSGRPAWVASAAYGLPECGGRAAVAARGCRLVANPGCHASAAILALHPLAAREGGLWGGRTTATVVSVTGSSGSGATPSQGTHHPERFSNFRAYKPLAHQHQAEIDLALAAAGGPAASRVAFVPCSGPMARGIGNVVLADVSEGLRARGVDPADDAAALAAVRGAYEAAYGREPFVRLVPEPAEVRAVAGTNFADVGVAVSRGTACVTVAIDNLGKGMAGTAVQNMNLLLGVPETTGLLRPGAGL